MTARSKMTMQEIIRAHLALRWGEYRDGKRPTPFVPVYELRGRDVAIDDHRTAWLGHSGDRRARELAHEGVIVVETRNGVAHYAHRAEAQPSLALGDVATNEGRAFIPPRGSH